MTSLTCDKKPSNLTRGKRMTGVKTNTDPRLILNPVDNPTQLQKASSNRSSFTSHVLENCAVYQCDILYHSKKRPISTSLSLLQNSWNSTWHNFKNSHSLRFSLFGHNARMPDETDAKKILTTSPWRTGGDHQDANILRGWRLLKSNNLSLNEAIDVAQNHPLWRLMSMFGVMHS